jgi:hypothetical protein
LKCATWNGTSTKFQAPAFAEAASRRQAKSQINCNDQNSNSGKQNLFGHLKLECGAYLGFGICDLEFGEPKKPIGE